MPCALNEPRWAVAIWVLSMIWTTSVVGVSLKKFHPQVNDASTSTELPKAPSYRTAQFRVPYSHLEFAEALSEFSVLNAVGLVWEGSPETLDSTVCLSLILKVNLPASS